MANTSNTGQTGERIAADYLHRKGFEIIEMNFKNDTGRRLGEIDIIAEEKNELVFVEVKTRKYNPNFSSLPEENITPEKLRKLSKIATAYLNLKNWRNRPYRFDAVSVWLDWDLKTAKIKHIPNIFI